MHTDPFDSYTANLINNLSGIQVIEGSNNTYYLYLDFSYVSMKAPPLHTLDTVEFRSDYAYDDLFEQLFEYDGTEINVSGANSHITDAENNILHRLEVTLQASENFKNAEQVRAALIDNLSRNVNEYNTQNNAALNPPLQAWSAETFFEDFQYIDVDSQLYMGSDSRPGIATTTRSDGREVFDFEADIQQPLAARFQLVTDNNRMSAFFLANEILASGDSQSQEIHSVTECDPSLSLAQDVKNFMTLQGHGNSIVLLNTTFSHLSNAAPSENEVESFTVMDDVQGTLKIDFLHDLYTNIFAPSGYTIPEFANHITGLMSEISAPGALDTITYRNDTNYYQMELYERLQRDILYAQINAYAEEHGHQFIIRDCEKHRSVTPVLPTSPEIREPVLIPFLEYLELPEPPSPKKEKPAPSEQQSEGEELKKNFEKLLQKHQELKQGGFTPAEEEELKRLGNELDFPIKGIRPRSIEFENGMEVKPKKFLNSEEKDLSPGL